MRTFSYQTTYESFKKKSSKESMKLCFICITTWQCDFGMKMSVNFHLFADYQEHSYFVSSFEGLSDANKTSLARLPY
jgi:hypothetical protein